MLLSQVSTPPSFLPFLCLGPTPPSRLVSLRPGEVCPVHQLGSRGASELSALCRSASLSLGLIWAINSFFLKQVGPEASGGPEPALREQPPEHGEEDATGSGCPEVVGISAGASNHASLLNLFCLEVLSCLIDRVNAHLDLRF